MRERVKSLLDYTKRLVAGVFLFSNQGLAPVDKKPLVYDDVPSLVMTLGTLQQRTIVAVTAIPEIERSNLFYEKITPDSGICTVRQLYRIYSPKSPKISIQMEVTRKWNPSVECREIAGFGLPPGESQFVTTVDNGLVRMIHALPARTL